MTGDPAAPVAEPPLEAWAHALEATVVAGARFDRVRVLADTASTQDAAARLAAGRPGLIVACGRQTAGRGRHGRKWADTAELGLAMTFVVDGGLDDQALALAGGLGALRAAEEAAGPGLLGLKWPNDVVERSPGRGGVGAQPGRKLAGVLVERRGPVALVGIGINVHQGPGDWPAELAGRCISLRMLGSTATRLDVACALARRLEEALGLSSEELHRELEQRRLAGSGCESDDSARRADACADGRPKDRV